MHKIRRTSLPAGSQPYTPSPVTRDLAVPPKIPQFILDNQAKNRAATDLQPKKPHAPIETLLEPLPQKLTTRRGTSALTQVKPPTIEE
jgi:hypothetical protein